MLPPGGSTIDRRLIFFRFWIVDAEGFYGHGLNPLFFYWTVAVICLYCGDFVYNIKALDNLTKACIFSV